MEKKQENMKSYWDNRYASGGNSGAGSYNTEAVTKAQIINHWMNEFKLRTISEIGCGDGNNLLFYKVDMGYSGYDYSSEAIELCKEKTKRIPNSLKYYFTDKPENIDYQADVCLCLDVWYHQTEDKDFNFLCHQLFELGDWKYMIVYTTDTNNQFTQDGTPLAPHVRFREFLSEVDKYSGKWEVVYWISGFNSSDGLTKHFPSEKKMFLLRNKSLHI